MSIPAELRYTTEHEWVSVEGTLASVGITEYAAQQLGDVVYVSLPTVGTAVTAGEPCGDQPKPCHRPFSVSTTESNAPLDQTGAIVTEDLWRATPAPTRSATAY